MSRIDYSKWDNIDTGSESEDDNPAPAPRRPAAAAPPRPAAPPAAVAAPGPNPSGPGVLCTYAPCRGDRTCLFFSDTYTPEDHPVFTQGAASPVGQLVGLPVRIWRLDPRPSLSIPRTAVPRAPSMAGVVAADLDNQCITYIMIDPVSGFAPPAWQQGIGTVIVARPDRKPLPAAHVEALWMFCDRLLGRFGGDEPVDPALEMTPAKFREFYEEYREGMLEAPARKAQWRPLAAPWDIGGAELS